MLALRTAQRFPDGAFTAAWDELVESDPAATIFHSARFLARWCRHLRGDCDLRLRFVCDGDRLAGVVPEVRETSGRGREVHFAGGEHVTDYLGPVSLPDDRERVVDAWFGALEAEDDWDVVVAAGLAEDAGWHELVAARARAAGFGVTGPDDDAVCPRVDLAGGWDGYLGRITGKQRHEIRRKARKLAREAGVVKLVAVDPADLHDGVDAFVELHRTSPGEKGRFFADDEMTAFFHALADEFGADGTLRLHRLDVDGRPGAVTVSLVGGGTWGLYNSAFADDLRALAPGMVLVAELVRMAGEEGCAVFDLLRGDEAYKYRLGAEDRRLRRVEVTRS